MWTGAPQGAPHSISMEQAPSSENVNLKRCSRPSKPSEPRGQSSCYRMFPLADGDRQADSNPRGSQIFVNQKLKKMPRVSQAIVCIIFFIVEV